MLRVFVAFGKLYSSGISLFDLLSGFYASLDFHTLPCPACGAKHPGWTVHDRYERSAIDWKKGAVVDELIQAIRLHCTSCGATHVVLPPWIIPYAHYSLFFVVAVLRDYYVNQQTVQSIREKYGIASSTLYRWKAVFEAHQSLWLRLLNDALLSVEQFLDAFRTDEIADSLQGFLLLVGRSFLQRGGRRTAHCQPP